MQWLSIIGYCLSITNLICPKHHTPREQLLSNLHQTLHTTNHYAPALGSDNDPKVAKSVKLTVTFIAPLAAWYAGTLGGRGDLIWVSLWFDLHVCACSRCYCGFVYCSHPSVGLFIHKTPFVAPLYRHKYIHSYSRPRSSYAVWQYAMVPMYYTVRYLYSVVHWSRVETAKARPTAARYITSNLSLGWRPYKLLTKVPLAEVP